MSDIIWEISSSASAPWEISDNLGKTFPSSASWDFFLLIDFWQSGLEEEGQVSCKYYVDVCIGGWDVLDSEERGQISHRRLCSWVLWPCKRGRCQNHFGKWFDSHFWETLRQQGVRNFWRGLHHPRGWSEESIWLCFSIHLFCHLCFAHVHNQQLRRIPPPPLLPP